LVLLKYKILLSTDFVWVFYNCFWFRIKYNLFLFAGVFIFPKDCVKNPLNKTQKLLRGELISSKGQAVRKSRISENRASWIMNGAYREAGCREYVGGFGFAYGCNCLDYSTRFWHFITAGWEDFRIGIGNGRPLKATPDQVVEMINNHNNTTRGDMLDGGRVWQ
jgi:hypothetical protein